MPPDLIAGSTEDVCSNGRDDDRDGRTDCDDPDCSDSCACGASSTCRELCASSSGNGIDDDEDGVTDEGCPCAFDEGGTSGVCTSSVIAADGTCSPPAGYQPNEITCDNRDNDCDGATDEGCPCFFMNVMQGVCRQGAKLANNTCGQPIGFQGSEVSCDGLDNDCDGVTDEGCTSCPFMGLSAGVCAFGQPRDIECNAPSSYQSDESACDGLDNDCDATTDEGCPCSFSGTNTGVCRRGVVQVGTGLCTEPLGYQEAESRCDGLDNDCDGVTDEGCTPCSFMGSSVGVCAFGEDTDEGCRAPATHEAEESACDGLDNDCDGITDEGCPCDFDGRPFGVCSTATRRTDADGDCLEPATYEVQEGSCDDRLDNDCDGAVDCADPDCSSDAVCP